jgi:hypothetical protein
VGRAWPLLQAFTDDRGLDGVEEAKEPLVRIGPSGGGHISAHGMRPGQMGKQKRGPGQPGNRRNVPV